LSFALLVWEFVFSGIQVGGCELRMGWARPLFRHRKYRCQPTASCLKVLVLARFFTAGSRWCSWKCVSLLT